MDGLDLTRDAMAKREMRKRKGLTAETRPRIPKRKKDVARKKPPPKQEPIVLENPVIAELLMAVAKKDVEKVHDCLDQLWRQDMTTGVEEAIRIGQAFCRGQPSTL